LIIFCPYLALTRLFAIADNSGFASRKSGEAYVPVYRRIVRWYILSSYSYQIGELSNGKEI
jgi:hypothetical protein